VFREDGVLRRLEFESILRLAVGKFLASRTCDVSSLSSALGDAATQGKRTFEGRGEPGRLTNFSDWVEFNARIGRSDLLD
jgi:hypothetical protein